VKGGIGGAVELGQGVKRPLSVDGLKQRRGFTRQEDAWQKDASRVSHPTFTRTGPRRLTEVGRPAVTNPFRGSFGPSCRMKPSIDRRPSMAVDFFPNNPLPAPNIRIFSGNR
jgi:hypothetical protein